MAIASITRTTLSAAITATAEYISLTSLTGVVNKDVLVCENEAMLVADTRTTLANPIRVVRGTGGTRAAAHKILAHVFHDTPEKFQARYDHTVGLFGDSGTLPQYAVPGSRAKDGAGNEYVAVDISYTGGIYSGVTCVISIDGLYTAAPLATGTHGTVGLSVEQASSDQLTWLQIYGANSYAQDAGATTSATSASVCIAATSVSTPAAGMHVIAPGTSDVLQVIHGMFCTGTHTSTGTSAASFTGSYVPVWLNYPFTDGFNTALQTTASASS